MPASILGYVLRFTGWHQAGLAALSVAVFLLSAVPLELQRRIVNDAIGKGSLQIILGLAMTYAAVALVEQCLKLGLNIYRGWVAESSVRTLRHMVRAADTRSAEGLQPRSAAGVEVAMVLEEAEPIGGFTGVSISEPLLQGGILASVIGYMVYLDSSLALLGLAFFVPQMVFVPLLQAAINRRAAARIVTKRAISGAIVEGMGPGGGDRGLQGEPIERVFGLNMGIYKLKYAMNLLMNLMHHLSVAAALCLGGWLAVEGRIEVGTVVAIVGGLGKLNDPWGDLVNWGRELSVVAVKYRLFADAMDRVPRARSH
ncbi:MAG: ABC transporter ATP-binding protein [Alphaproteobacteria bacterium]|nr:ABC transporter ATP-binding protein [Alphaproteobacteria bacterium]